MTLVAPDARLIDGATGEVIGGSDLHQRISAYVAAYAARPSGAVFARIGLTVPSVLRYLGAFQAQRPVALLDPALDPGVLSDFVTRYEPALIVGVAEGAQGSAGSVPKGYQETDDATLGRIWVRAEPSGTIPHPDLAILLATSGSTGNPKFVRLSRAGVLANAEAIGVALGIDRTEIAPTSLPLFYSYGMSVLNSHLIAGATVLIVDGGVLAREYWQAVDRHGATSLAGVPYHYEMLNRIRWSPAKHPSIRTLTQAGGKLRDELIVAFHEKIGATGGGFYVMWGATEAGPRMSTLPATELPSRVGSVGLPLSGGSCSVLTDDGGVAAAGTVGEIVYRGPNVMMGYATEAADLAAGDELGGVLHTGDVGYLDADGFVWLKGRLNRFGKIFGVRVNLADLEEIARDTGPAAAVSGPDKVIVYLEGATEDDAAALAAVLADRVRIHRSGFDVRAIDRLPRLPNDKIDYRALDEWTAP